MTNAKIRIANFKSFADQTVELNGFKLLVGANASGKSNFVQAFKFLRDIATHGLEDAISLQGGVEYLPNIQIGDTQPLIFHVTLQQDMTWSVNDRRYRIHSFDYEFHLQFAKRGNRYTVVRDRMILTYWREENSLEEMTDPVAVAERRADYSPRSTLELKNSGGRLEILSNSAETEPLFTPQEIDFLKSTGKRSLSKRRLLLETPFANFFAESMWDWYREISIYDMDPQKAKRVIPVAGRSELETDGGNLAIVLRNLLDDEEARRSLRNLCRDNLPYFKDLAVEQLADRFLSITVREEYTEDKELPAFLISDGTITIMALVVALYFQDRFQFQIFEEPERHLHPKVISGLMELFKEASQTKQILVTTHSQQLVKYAGLENILLISRDKDGFSQISKPTDRKHVRIFLEHEVYSIDELFVDGF